MVMLMSNSIQHTHYKTRKQFFGDEWWRKENFNPIINQSHSENSI